CPISGGGEVTGEKRKMEKLVPGERGEWRTMDGQPRPPGRKGATIFCSIRFDNRENRVSMRRFPGGGGLTPPVRNRPGLPPAFTILPALALPPESTGNLPISPYLCPICYPRKTSSDCSGK